MFLKDYLVYSLAIRCMEQVQIPIILLLSVGGPQGVKVPLLQQKLALLELDLILEDQREFQLHFVGHMDLNQQDRRESLLKVG